MYTVREYLQPWYEFYNRWMNGEEVSRLLQFKIQKGLGNSYISKVFRAQLNEIYSQYENITKNVSEPMYSNFLADNFTRIFLLNIAQRLIAAYQAAPFIERVGRPTSYSFLFTEIMNDGAFRGALRGASVNALQASTVLWPSIYITNTQKNGYFGFLGTYLLMDALLHPLDTLKTSMYAHTTDPVGWKYLRSARLYSGLAPKALFNIPFATALYSTTQSDWDTWVYWLVTAAFYPLLALKSTLQVSEGRLQKRRIQMSYRGVVPFILLNSLASWKLFALYSEDKQREVLVAAQELAMQKVGKT